MRHDVCRTCRTRVPVPPSSEGGRYGGTGTADTGTDIPYPYPYLPYPPYPVRTRYGSTHSDHAVPAYPYLRTRTRT